MGVSIPNASFTSRSRCASNGGSSGDRTACRRRWLAHGPQQLQCHAGMWNSLRLRLCRQRRAIPVQGLPNVDRALLCTSITGTSVAEALELIAEGNQSGADVLELRLDFYLDFSSSEQLKTLMDACEVPYIVTYRPSWEGGLYNGDEDARLAMLRQAALLGAPAIDVEYAASKAFTSVPDSVPEGTTFIMSSHNFSSTPSLKELQETEQGMREAGADVAKLAMTAQDICDAKTMLDLLKARKGPLISLSMGEKGVISRLLATKYGGYLTFATTSSGKESAPGQPSLESLKHMYRSDQQTASSKVFGIIGNPVSHSRSPVLHNTAMHHLGLNSVFVPLLVDDMDSFCETFTDNDWHGFCVTIPHKEAACRLSNADDVAAKIGAVNTLVRQADGTLNGHNTDWEAAICAVAKALWEGKKPRDPELPLRGLTAVVLGTGGAARALAFGAATLGARVVVAGRSLEKAQELASAVLDACCFSGDSMGILMEDVQSGALQRMDIVLNTTPLGMVGGYEHMTPLPRDILDKYKPLAFDAVYTPMHTRFLQEAQSCGCKVVTGLEMFVGQAAKQFEFFTGEEPPVDMMQSTVLESLGETVSTSH